VIPSLPGYGFSGKPAAAGWDPARIARAWVVLMKRLGYMQLVGARSDRLLTMTWQFRETARPRYISIQVQDPLANSLVGLPGY